MKKDQFFENICVSGHMHNSKTCHKLLVDKEFCKTSCKAQTPAGKNKLFKSLSTWVKMMLL